MTKSQPEVVVDQIFQFRDFLSENVGDITIVLAVIFGSLVALLFALREIVSWLSRTHILRGEIQGLTREVQDLKVEIKRLQTVATPAHSTVEKLAPGEALDLRTETRENPKTPIISFPLT